MNNQTKLLVAQAGKSLGLCRLEPPSVPVLLTVAYVNFYSDRLLHAVEYSLSTPRLQLAHLKSLGLVAQLGGLLLRLLQPDLRVPSCLKMVSCQALRHLGLQFFSPPTNDDKWSRVVLKV